MLYLFNFLRKKDLLLEVIHYILFRIKLICVITEIKREGLINGGYFFGYFTPDGKPSRGKLIINNNTFIGTFSESDKKKHGFLIKGDTIKKSDSLFKGFFDENGNFVNGICYNFIKGTESIFETKITINKINKEINIKKEERRFVEVTENENNDILEKEVFQLSERGYTRYISNKNSIYVLTEANGRILISTEEHFNDGKIKKGKIIESNGDISEGTFNEEGRLEKGIIKKINGDIITRGSFNENYKIIEGIEFIKQENVGYHCNFDFSKNKMKTEKIFEKKNNGDVFVGSIVDDGKIKYGQLTKKNGDRFEGFFDESGSFLEGVRHKEIGTKRYEDKIIADGGELRNFTTLWWRTWRYVNINISTSSEPLIINDVYGTFSAYPFKNETSFFAPGHHDLNQMLEIGWRTARLCANETYMDCPYYEQLQYFGEIHIFIFFVVDMHGT